MEPLGKWANHPGLPSKSALSWISKQVQLEKFIAQGGDVQQAAALDRGPVSTVYYLYMSHIPFIGITSETSDVHQNDRCIT